MPSSALLGIRRETPQSRAPRNAASCCSSIRHKCTAHFAAFVSGASISIDDPQAVAAWVARDIGLLTAEGQVQLGGVVVLPRAHLRSPSTTTAQIWRVADNATCRAHLVASCRGSLVAGRDAVVEGRDATTVICPDARLKIFLDASPEERARSATVRAG
jgi:cytidylate kinase